MKKIIILLIFIISCKEQTALSPADPFALTGRWVVTDYFSTNGPICYGININDTVEFRKIISTGNRMIYQYKLSTVAYRDTFEIDSMGTSLHAEGNYNYYNPMSSDPPPGHQLRQTLDVDFLAGGRIECFMKVETWYAPEMKYKLGDVSHYIAKKL